MIACAISELPAPTKPAMPTTSPGRDVERDIAEDAGRRQALDPQRRFAPPADLRCGAHRARSSGRPTIDDGRCRLRSDSSARRVQTWLPSRRIGHRVDKTAQFFETM